MVSQHSSSYFDYYSLLLKLFIALEAQWPDFRHCMSEFLSDMIDVNFFNIFICLKSDCSMLNVSVTWAYVERDAFKVNLSIVIESKK